MLKLKIIRWILVIFITYSAHSMALPPELEQCGITIEKSFQGQDDAHIFFEVNVERDNASVDCPPIRGAGLSRFRDGEFIIFPTPDLQHYQILIQVRVDSLDQSTLYFHVSDQNNESTTEDIKVNLADI